METRRKRVRLWVAYDGTNYHGWQIQKNGNTIEAELNLALSELLGEETSVIGASRTDAGVHALGNVAVFDTDSPIPAEKFCHALNARLPEDVRIMRSDEVPGDWHPRKRESHKTYEYHIYLGEFLPPTRRLYAYHVYRSLDLKAMREAANFLVGEHDFKSFCQENAQVESTVRRIYGLELELQKEPVREAGGPGVRNALGEMPSADVAEKNLEGELVLRITGNGFLYNMVRIIVGTLLEVGVGRLTPENVKEILEKRDRSVAGPTAPAKGLILAKYEFGDDSIC